MPDNNAEMLKDCVARNLAAVLSLPSAGMLRHCKSRFLGEVEGGILMEAPTNEGPLLDALVNDKTPCGISFRNGTNKVMFAAPVRRIQHNWKISDQISADAVLLEFPSTIKSIQRRANYRVTVPTDIGLSLRVWRLSTAAYIKEQPQSAQEIRCDVRDLSVNGVGVHFHGKDGDAPKVTPEDRLRVQITIRDLKMIIEGRMRNPSKICADGSWITGISFKKLENDLEGRQTAALLTRLVGELQREEIRRTRMGLAQAG